MTAAMAVRLLAEMGADIRRNRKRLRISQVELARALGVSDSTVSAIEQGRTAVSVITQRRIYAYFAAVRLERIQARETRMERKREVLA